MIAAFLQLRNESSNGHLRRCMENVSQYANEIFIYDDCSTDNSRDIYLEYTREDHIIFAGEMQFTRELYNKQRLLDLTLEHKPDWIVWQDGDAIFDRKITCDCKYLLAKLTKDGFDGAALRVLNLWRHPAFYRHDAGHNDLRYICFWRNNGKLHYNATEGLHQKQHPLGMDKIAQLPMNNAILHYGFTSEEDIAKKYLMYKALGQPDYPGQSGEPRLLDEISSFDVRKVPRLLYPEVNVPEDYETAKKPEAIRYTKYKRFNSWDEYCSFKDRDATESMDAFWEKAHQNKDQLWLTGSNPKEVYTNHNVGSIISDNKNLSILEIGIGLGDSIRFLSERHKVTAMDISADAFKAVECDTVLTKDFTSIQDKQFDFILCHLVLQHCDDEMVEYLLSNSFRCLKAKGIFSFQFAVLPPGQELDDFYKTTLNSIHYFRTNKQMADIVKKANGKVVGQTLQRSFPAECNIIWKFMKCSRSDSTKTISHSSPRISVVMTYFNRREQLVRTLHSISNSSRKSEAEILIVDDCSSEDQRIEDLEGYRGLDVKVIRLEPEDSWWKNPCIPYNLAFNQVKGDIVLIQNSETMHMGDLIRHALDYTRDELWMSYGCYAINKATTDRLPAESYLRENPTMDLLGETEACIFPREERPAFVTDQTGWYNHPKIRATGFHFAVAITRTSLEQLVV